MFSEGSEGLLSGEHGKIYNVGGGDDMRAVRKKLQSLLLIGMSVVMLGGAPLAAYAEETPAADTTSTTPSSTDTTTPTTPAPTTTTAPASATDSQSMNSSSTPTAPKPTYVYDSSTGHWNTDQWQYDTTSGAYKPITQPITPPPAAPDTTSSTSATTTTTNSAIATALNSIATSGDASVLSNGTAGDATTGNASSAATIMNNVNSSMTNADNKQAASFVSNVMGDVNGDIMLQPMLLKAMLEANAANTSTTTTNNTGLTNNISLSANSGDATVSSNTSAGNATTGSANTVANVVNVINSLVAANQSFIGTINIYGNLNGDILIAPDFIPQLLATNGQTPTNSSATVTDNSTQSVVNNIALAAKTGAAVVDGNTVAGSATTGNATTNTVIFNLTNHAIVASDSLLVFINVLGRWVGVIVDAPTGATAAAIGDGVTSNSVSPSLTVNTTDNALLTNNINLTSQSGDATVTRNTNAGGATTGNATASANIANITGSQLGLSGWFGVLFINVFGSWLGSFGVNTAAGNPIVQPPAQTQGGNHANAPLQVIEFMPHNLHQTATVIQGAFTAQTGASDNTKPTSSANEVLSAMTNKQQDPPAAITVSSSAVLQSIISALMLLGALLLFGGIMNRYRKVLV